MLVAILVVGWLGVEERGKGWRVGFMLREMSMRTREYANALIVSILGRVVVVNGRVGLEAFGEDRVSSHVTLVGVPGSDQSRHD